MRVPELIEKKRDGLPLTAEEIKQFIAAYAAEEIPDYQVSAMLMAIYFRGMDKNETAALTEALIRSGETLDFSDIGPVADKHSTGGVGDKTTLVLLPLAAAAGVKIAKMSGRGLGHTGGTIDKLSCIPGFRTDLPQEAFRRQVREIGLAITGQTPRMTPADGKLYALRDVTATVDSIPLIASSVMSKKIASGAQHILLDVKMGSGAFMQDLDSARELARTMTEIGSRLGRKTIAYITAMDQPLGFAVGNHIEVLEAIETLKGEGPRDLTDIALSLGAEMLTAGGLASTHKEAVSRLEEFLHDGTALAMFKRFVAAQGGDASVVVHPQKLGEPAHKADLRADASGYVCRVDARKVGYAAVLLGAGRQTKEEAVDLLAGIRLHKKTGDYAAAGERIATVFCSDKNRIEAAAAYLKSAFSYSQKQAAYPPLIYERIEA